MTDQSYPLASFTWDKECLALYTDASTLRWAPGHFPEMIRIKSHHTGETESFMKARISQHPTDIEAVYYYPLGQTKVARVTIFND